MSFEVAKVYIVMHSVKKIVKKYSPETNCKKIPRQLCGPSGCELSPGPEFCFDKQETVVQEVFHAMELYLILQLI